MTSYNGQHTPYRCARGRFVRPVCSAMMTRRGGHRDSELDVGRPLSRTFEELTRRRLAHRMSLRRLPAESVTDMLRALAGQEPPSGLAQVVYAETEGNPFFVEEVFKHLAEEGRLFDADGRFRTDLAAEDVDVPEGVRLVVGARLRRLGEEGPRVLGAAAVLGRVFAFELLGRLEPVPEQRLLDLVEDAERARLISAVDDDRYIFAHELIRQTVLAELSAPRRRRLHARAAEALEAVHASDLEPEAATIANHLVQAGPADPKRTFQYLVMAGKWALQAAAFEEALAHLERAAGRIDAAGPTERADLLFHLGAAQRSSGQWDEAISTWEQAIDAYEAAGDVEEAARICYDAALSLTWASRFGEAFAIQRRGIELAGEEVSAVRARLLAQQALVLALIAPFAAGDAAVSQALAIADELEDPALRGQCLMYLPFHRYFWLYADECAGIGLEAAELLRAAGNLWEESTILAFAAVGLVDCGRFAEAREVEADLEPRAERLGNFSALMICRRVKGMVDFAETGDLVAFEAFGRADLEINLDNGLPWGCASHTWIGLAYFLRGDWDTARHHFETGAALEPPGGWHGHCRAHLLEFLAYAGDRDAVLAMLDDADGNRMPVAGRINQWGSWAVLFSAVEALHVLGEDRRAGDLHDLVVECIDVTRAVGGSYHDVRLVQRVAGIAAAAGRRWDAAEAHFRTALRQAEELPHLPEQAHTRRFFAEMLIERDLPGDRAEAARLISEAADLYRRLGMPRHLDMVEV